LADCQHPDREVVIKKARALRGINFKGFSSCYHCAAPQKIYIRWEEKASGLQQFKENKKRRCQYEGVIRTAFATMMVTGPVEVANKVYRLLKENGIWDGDKEHADMDEDEREQVKGMMIQWFGQKIEWGGMKASRFIRVFYQVVI
jgi:hypothetical protein